MCTLNFAGPLTLNLFREIIIIQAVIAVSIFTGFRVFILCFFSAAYNLNLYARTQQGSPLGSERGKESLRSREMLVLAYHVFPCLAVLLNITI